MNIKRVRKNENTNQYLIQERKSSTNTRLVDWESIQQIQVEYTELRHRQERWMTPFWSQEIERDWTSTASKENESTLHFFLFAVKDDHIMTMTNPEEKE